MRLQPGIEVGRGHHAHRLHPLTLGAVVVFTLLVSGCAPEGTVGPSATVSDRSTSSSPSAGPVSSPSASPIATDDVVPDPRPSAETGTVRVTIVSSGADGRAVYASGLVSGAAGSGGTCILVATAPDGSERSAQIVAQPTPSAVNCGLVEIEAPAGKWTLVLTYTADGVQQSSEPVTVEQM